MSALYREIPSDATIRKAFPVDEGEKAAFERGPISLQSSLDCLPRWGRVVAATADSDNSRECQVSAQGTSKVSWALTFLYIYLHTVKLICKYLIRNQIFKISAQLKAQVRSEIQQPHSTKLDPSVEMNQFHHFYGRLNDPQHIVVKSFLQFLPLL